MQGDITLDGEPLTPEPGKTYTGDIQVTGSIRRKNRNPWWSPL